MSNDQFFMAGTEGTGAYTVVAATNRARVGFRDLGSGRFRVRVEPESASSAKTLAPAFPAPTWKQVGDGEQYRFSTVVESEAGMQAAVAAAVKAVARFARSVSVNPQAPAWALELTASK